METIYSRTDGWPSFACWQVSCCQHFRLLSYREQQFGILIGTQKDILYSFSWAFTGTGRCTKENGGEERKLMYKYDSNAKTLSLYMMISAYKSFDEKKTKTERMKGVKREVLPCRGYCRVFASSPSDSCCSNNQRFVTVGRTNVWALCRAPARNGEISHGNVFPLWLGCSL